MRTKSAQASAVLANVAHTARILLEVADSGGTLQSIVDACGESPIESVKIEESVDAVRTATVSLQMAQGLRSRSPFNVGAGNPEQLSAASMTVGREVKITAVVTPDDSSLGPITGLSLEIFRGYVDELQTPGPLLELTCTDQTAKLRDTWIERERVYGLCTGVNATRGAYVWRYDLPAFAVGDLVLPSELKANAHFYKVTAGAGAPTATEPVWPTGAGSTVVSGGVTFTEAGITSAIGTAVETVMQQILTDNIGAIALATLAVPVSPSWVITPYIQARTSVQDAMQQFATQLGWRCCFVWNAGAGAYQLTLFAPDRTRVTVDLALAVDQELECTDLGVDLFSIRNVVQVVYGDSAVMDPHGTPWRKTIAVTDAPSVAKYGRRFMEVSEADVSAIDSAAEATQLANYILADLKEPLLGMRLSIPIDPFIEIGDMVQVPADARRFSSANLLAVEGLEHSFDSNGARTSLTLRGQPVAARAGWLTIEGRHTKDVHLTSLLTQLGPTAQSGSVVGGQRLDLINGQTLKGGRKFGRNVEVHLSTSPGFTPSSATKVAATSGQSVEVGNLVPGKTYYQQVVPFIEDASQKVRGSPSAEVAFTAGRAKAGHYDSLVSQGHSPLNGNFEHALDDLTSNPFDQWSVTSGSWGSSGDLYWGNDATYGNYLTLRLTAGDPRLKSSAFPVRRMGGHFNIYTSVRPQGTLTATRRLMIYVRFYRKADLSDSPILFTHQVPHTVAAPNVWANYVINSAFIGALPNDVNFCTIEFGKEDISNAYGWDVGDVFFCEAQQEDLWATTRAFLPTIYGASTTTPASIFQESWIAPSFTAGWGNIGTGLMTAGYYKNAAGQVHLRGVVVRSSGVATIIFNLPAAYRPSLACQYAVSSNSAFAQVDVGSSGNVVLSAGSVASVSLDGITFDTR